MTTTDILQFTEAVARQAGDILREGYGNVRHIQQKGVIDLVTEFDKRSEDVILSAIQQKFPDHAILAEESGRNKTISEFQWVIDPLDGTTNFAHGFPHFAVTMALFQKDAPILGVTYDPLRDEMFSAQAGCGATLNNHPIHVSTQAKLERAVISTGFPYDLRTNPRNNFTQFVHLQRRTTAVRHLASAALDCAWTAAGRLDGYWEFGVEPWDIGAGVLLVREAGGRVTAIDEEENFLSRASLLVSNSLLHEQMVRVLREGDLSPLP
jgi:myo-inositol-1(or 4)-monophosphatase